MQPLSAQTPLSDSAGARAVDAYAIEVLGVPGIDLMRSAAAAAARVVRGRFPLARRIVIVCGSGNNGGDGYEVARLLAAHGRDVRIVRITGRDATGDAAQTLDAARGAGIPVDERPDGAISDLLGDAHLIVDALLGTGATGAPTGGVAQAITAICEAALPVVSLDVPSGVDASTGEVPGAAIHADGTVAFHCDKLGLHVAPGCEHAGAVVVASIGIPADGPTPAAAIGVRDGRALLPGRAAGGSKYDAGAVLVLGGSVGMAGAPGLVAAAALRAGAGVVTALVPEAVQPTVAGALREAMVRPLPSNRPDLEIERYAERASCVVLGPGIGREPEAETIVRTALALDRPLVVDADALWWVARDPATIASRTAPTVITPHAGEAARLLGIEAAAIARHRLRTVSQLVELTGAVSLLKGADTLVLAPDGRLGVRLDDCAALATAGSGDVLAGIIGACVARGADPWTAAIAGAAAHVAAGRAAVATRPGRAIIAGDLI
ncbi:MAG: NAD(P)H-hydrate dehydratase [Gaiellales bacterium]